MNKFDIIEKNNKLLSKYLCKTEYKINAYNLIKH